MSESNLAWRRPTPAGLIAGAVVIAGFLLIFGGAWLIFVILSTIDEGSLLGLFMGSLLIVPFFTMAWLAGRWPKVAGLALLGFSAFFVYFFGLYEVVTDPFGKGRAMVIIFFMGPLMTAGLALLRAEPEDSTEESGAAE